VLAPEADELVGRFRQEHDPSAAAGVPAHITINYPFKPEMSDGESLRLRLEAMFAGVAPFDFSFRRLSRLPNVLYLPPEPEEPFLDLIHLVAQRFPESPPYEGRHMQVIPHLTVAESEDEAVLTAVEAELTPLLASRLPIQSRAETVWLIDNSSGLWQHRAAFPLGGE
jgi:hypothetical protein